MINLFVIDDHPLIAAGLESLFTAEDAIKVSGRAESSKEALQKLNRSMARVVILDLGLPDLSGIDLCAVIKQKFPDKKVIILTGSLDTVELYKVWYNKADAILLKHGGKEELVESIHHVMAGRRIIGAGVPVFDAVQDKDDKGPVRITPAETRVLKLLAEGQSRKEIARLLGTKMTTVSFHCNNLFAKFNQTKLVMVVDEARKQGLI